MRVLLCNFCALIVCGLASFCSYPPLMSGLAAESMGYHFYRFSISVPDQKAMFRLGWGDPEKAQTWIFLDYGQHRKYEYYNGGCISSPLEKSLQILQGPPEDAEILNERPAPPALPRTITFRSKAYKEIYVAVDLMYDRTCYPLGISYIKLTPSKRLADHYVVKNETFQDPSGLTPNLTSCVEGQGWVAPWTNDSAV